MGLESIVVLTRIRGNLVCPKWGLVHLRVKPETRVKFSCQGVPASRWL